MNIRSVKRLIAGVAGILLLCVYSVYVKSVYAQSGGPYEIKSSVIAGGGGSSSGGTYALTGTTGQSVAGGPASGSTYALGHGFWQTFPGAAGWTVSGLIQYGTDETAPFTFVPNVLLTATGTPTTTDTTDAAGAYDLTGLGSGSYNVTLAKSGAVNGITSGDGTLVLRHVASGGTLLSANKQIAADANGSSTVTSGDATLILRYVAAGTPFPNPTGHTWQQVNTWRFVPASRSYAGLSSDLAGENFFAILTGEVSGGWSPSFAPSDDAAEATGEMQRPVYITRPVTLSADASQATGSVTITLPNASASNGSTVLVPVNLTNNGAKEIVGYSFSVDYNNMGNVLGAAVCPAATTCIETAGSLSATGWVVTSDNVNPTPAPGFAERLGVAAATGGVGITATSGVLVFLRFTVTGTDPMSTTLSFSGLNFEDPMINTIPSNGVNGSFTVLPPTAAGVNVGGRVVTADGRGISRTTVTISGGPLAEPLTALTSSFGYFNFEGIASGHTYVVSVSGKTATFGQPSQVIQVGDGVVELVFVANPQE